MSPLQVAEVGRGPQAHSAAERQGGVRFDKLYIGEVFFHASHLKGGTVFEKKSLSSAWTLHPVTFKRTKLDGFVREFCEFSGSVDVHSFTEQAATPPASQAELELAQ